MNTFLEILFLVVYALVFAVNCYMIVDLYHYEQRKRKALKESQGTCACKRNTNPMQQAWTHTIVRADDVFAARDTVAQLEKSGYEAVSHSVSKDGSWYITMKRPVR